MDRPDQDRSKKTSGCAARPTSRERYVRDMGYCAQEQVILAIARHYLLTFAEPHRQSWMRANALASAMFKEDLGPRISNAVLDVVQELRAARGSVFRFSNPDCPGCSAILSEAERQLMGIITAQHRGMESTAHAHALMVCEGNDTSGLIAASSRLAVLVSACDNSKP